jgi:hypothetical protein
MTYARRKDGNQTEVVNALRKAGYPCYLTFRLGRGFPDTLVLSKADIAVLLEIKVPGEGLTPDEVKFHAGYTGPIEIVESGVMAISKMSKYD